MPAGLAGKVVMPGSPSYEALRKPAIATFDDARPQAIALCESLADVVAAIAFAQRSELPVATRSGGHCFAGRSSSDGLVIDVTRLSSVSVADGVATVGAGARLGDLYDALLAHGLTLPAGCGPTVGIAGLTLGGGLGILGRSHGLTSDQLIGAEVVLADGRVATCDEGAHEDLFWALRGAGGGQFGVVTSLTFKTIPVPPLATPFHLVWPFAHAAAVIDAWQAWAPAAPDELAASLLISAGGGGAEVNVFGAMIASERETAQQLDELIERVAAKPASASRREMTYRDTKRYLAELGEQMTTHDQPAEEGHPFSKSEFFRRPLPGEAIEALLEHFSRERVRGVRRELDFTPWAGAYNRAPAGATAFPHRSERFLLKQAVVIDPGVSPEQRVSARRWLDRSWELGHPWGSGGVYPNFPDPELDDWPRAYHGDNYERLRRIKRAYDPHGFFRFHQSIPA